MEPYNNWIVNVVTVNEQVPWDLEGGLLKSQKVRESFLHRWLLAETWRMSARWHTADSGIPTVVCEWHLADAWCPTGWQYEWKRFLDRITSTPKKALNVVYSRSKLTSAARSDNRLVRCNVRFWAIHKRHVSFHEVMCIRITSKALYGCKHI